LLEVDGVLHAPLDSGSSDGQAHNAGQAADGTARILLREALLRAVEELEPTLKSVFIYRELKGLSTEETAQTLRTSQGAVRTRLCRARKEVWRRVCASFDPSRHPQARLDLATPINVTAGDTPAAGPSKAA